MFPLLRSSLFTVALIAGMAASGREARAQATYVGTFAMTNGASDKCLTDPNNSLGYSDLASNPWAAVPSQEWAFFLLPNGFFAIMNAESTLFLEAEPENGFGGPTLVHQNKWNAGLNQMWYLYPLGNHFYVLVNASSLAVLTDPNMKNESGVTEATWTGTLNQWWYLYFLRL